MNSAFWPEVTSNEPVPVVTATVVASAVLEGVEAPAELIAETR